MFKGTTANTFERRLKSQMIKSGKEKTVEGTDERQIENSVQPWENFLWMEVSEREVEGLRGCHQ